MRNISTRLGRAGPEKEEEGGEGEETGEGAGQGKGKGQGNGSRSGSNCVFFCVCLGREA